MPYPLSSLLHTATILPLLVLLPLACADKSGATSASATAASDASSNTSDGSSGGASSSSGSTDSTATTESSPTSGTSNADGSSSSGGGETGEVCGADGPWLEPLGPGDEPCEPPAVEACVTEDALDGLRRCLAFEIAEDVTEWSWGPCMPSCGPEQREDARACGPGDAGISYCGELYVDGASTDLWFPCLDPLCLPCAPGDTALCGPETPYPDTLMTCYVSDGVPVWFDGDCYT